MFIDTEDILSRLHALQWLQKRSPYVQSKTRNDYWIRINATLDSIPPIHEKAAIALFSRVIYLDEALLEEVTRQMVSEISSWCSTHGIVPMQDTQIFSVDHPELIKHFFDYGWDSGWEGRADQKLQSNIVSCSQLLQRLIECKDGHKDTIDQVRQIFRKKVWIVITDNALGGGSALSDIQRLRRLLELFDKSHSIKLLFATQTYSTIANQKLASIDIAERFYGLYFSDEWRINHYSCKLFSPKMLEDVRRFCHWFGIECFGRPYPDKSSYPFINTVDRHCQADPQYDRNFSYGWHDCGFTIVTYKNSPTNSVPPLWYPCNGESIPARPSTVTEAGNENDPARSYRPPFPRNSSRKTQTTAGDGVRLNEVEAIADTITTRLVL